MESSPVHNTIDRLLVIAGQSKDWLKFIGLLLRIYGIITALMIIGILIVWLPIWMGCCYFRQAAEPTALRSPKTPTNSSQ